MKVAIIGAGISGVTAAVILKNYDKNIDITLYDDKEQVGGNCLDSYDNAASIYKQYYGPHIFHTNEKYIWNYLNSYSSFIPYQHKVKTYVNGELLQFPLSKDYMKNTIKSNTSIAIDESNAETYLYSMIGKEVTDTFFRKYSEKQWGDKLKNLPIDLVKRIPIRDNNDPRYFTDTYQGIPSNGFTKLIEEIIDSLKITYIKKQITFSEINGPQYDYIFNTGNPDFFFENLFGELEYRSIIFRFSKSLEEQQVAVVNYPNNYNFTRITQYNHFLKSLSFFGLEYPTSQDTPNSVKCYPVFWKEDNIKRYNQYAKFAADNNVILLGRMGKYKYFNIDAAIKDTFDTLTQFNSETLKKRFENGIPY